MADLRITELDHIVLNVGDVERSLAFYTGVLRLKGERVDDFRAGKVSFPSVRINGDTIIDLNPSKTTADPDGPTKNLAHYCLVAGDVDLAELVDDLKRQGVPVLRGPVSRSGARGQATSIYILDPDGNEIEIRCY